jgi:7,8-dihydroneopterin aldolase/epimerase/oxygenase
MLTFMYTVFIRGIEFYGYHGVPAEEQFIGHRYRVDLELRVEGAADTTDHISETVDYGAVGAVVVEMGTSGKSHTVERLARSIGERILTDYALVESLWISVAKPLPPAPMIAAEAGVEMELARG